MIYSYVEVEQIVELESSMLGGYRYLTLENNSYKFNTKRMTNSLTLLLSPDAHELILIPGYHK